MSHWLSTYINVVREVWWSHVLIIFSAFWECLWISIVIVHVHIPSWCWWGVLFTTLTFASIFLLDVLFYWWLKIFTYLLFTYLIGIYNSSFGNSIFSYLTRLCVWFHFTSPSRYLYSVWFVVGKDFSSFCGAFLHFNDYFLSYVQIFKFCFM